MYMPYGKCYAIMNVSIVEQSLQLTAIKFKSIKETPNFQTKCRLCDMKPYDKIAHILL